MIRFDQVTITYPDAERPALTDVNLHVPDGELCLVIGATGSGKTTLLQAINGLVPWFTGGTLAGKVTVDGRSTATHRPRELADLVGYVGQVPLAGFVTDVVEDELAYTMENLGTDPAVMRRRVEEILDLLGLAEVRSRPLRHLSAGQQQRVAIGSALAAAPRVLLLDEPTSALDPGAAEEVLAAVTRLVHDLGITVVAVEHRLERVVQYADRVVIVDGDRVTSGDPATMLVDAPVAPPVIELGRLAEWSPLPLSVRDARRRARAWREGHTPIPSAAEPSRAEPVSRPDGMVEVKGLCVAYGDRRALDGVELEVGAGEIVAVMGRNGAGKTSLLTTLAGMRAPAAGRVLVGGHSPHELEPQRLVRQVALVPSDPGVLLYASTVAAECQAADADAGLAPGTTWAAVTAVVGELDADRHPRDLSEGERLGLALGIVTAPRPRVLLLDEPTRGLDYPAKRRLVDVLAARAAEGTAIVLATHDVELVAEVAHRVVILADGQVVADGPAREIVSGSPMFAPQVAKIFAPVPVLTVAEAARLLAS